MSTSIPYYTVRLSRQCACVFCARTLNENNSNIIIGGGGGAQYIFVNNVHIMMCTYLL